MFTQAILLVAKTPQKGAAMAKETTAKHKAEALNHVAAELEDHAASLRGAAALLIGAEPVIHQVDIRMENSRKVGLQYIRNWVAAAKQAAFDARMDASQIGSIRISAKQKRTDTK